MLKEPKLPIEFSGLEIVFLTDSIKNDDKALGLPQADTYVPLARDLLLLMGSAYCEMFPTQMSLKPGTVTLHLTEEQVWLLRSKVVSGSVGMGNPPPNIGVGLLNKLYEALLVFNSGLPELDVTEVNDSFTEDQAYKLYTGDSDA